MIKVPRRLFTLVRDSAAGRKLAIRVSSWRHRRWLRNHPGATFGEYYAAAHVRKLSRGWPHATLGHLGWNEGGQATKWDSNSFARRGAADWQHICKLGVGTNDRVLDYGCGSLRIGQHAIRSLPPQCYRGLDVTDDFFGPAIELLDPEMLETKRPVVEAISEQSLSDARDWAPTAVFSNAVMQHVPPREIQTYLTSITSLLSPNSQALILFVEGEDKRRYQGMNWSYSGARLVADVEALNPGLLATVESLDPAHAAHSGLDKKLLRIRRTGPDERGAN